MFNLGMGEILVIMVVALLFLGPKQLPKLARQMGRGIREFRRAAQDFQTTLSEADLDEVDMPQIRPPTDGPEELKPVVSESSEVARTTGDRDVSAAKKNTDGEG